MAEKVCFFDSGERVSVAVAVGPLFLIGGALRSGGVLFGWTITADRRLHIGTPFVFGSNENNDPIVAVAEESLSAGFVKPSPSTGLTNWSL